MLLNCSAREKTLERPLDCKEIKPVNPKRSQHWIFFGKTDSEAEAPWKTPCWERLRAGEEDDRGWDGWMASLTQWTSIWANCGRYVILQSMGSPRVRHNWATEQQPTCFPLKFVRNCYTTVWVLYKISATNIQPMSLKISLSSLQMKQDFLWYV